MTYKSLDSFATKNCIDIIDKLNQQDLRNKMLKRIRTQSRISGEKTFLPMTFLQKYFYPKRNTPYNNFVHNIYEKTMMCVEMDGQRKHIHVKDIKELGIFKNSKVFCLCQDKVLQVFTSVGYLNLKEEMNVDSFSEIEIDHVKPIEKTLSTLRLPELDIITSIIKDIKKTSNLKGKDLESEAFRKFQEQNGRICLQDLEKELNEILNDTYYRLIDVKANRNKSNVIDYKGFYLNKVKKKYYAFIEEADDEKGNKMVIYQDLDNDKLLVSKKSVFDPRQYMKISLVEVPIDLL